MAAANRGLSAYSFVLSQTRGAKGVMARGVRNNFKLRGFLLSIYENKKTGGAAGGGAGAEGAPGAAGGAGSAKKMPPKYDVRLRLGSFQSDPEAVDGAHGVKVRKFEISRGQNVPQDKVPVGTDKKPLLHRILEPYAVLEFSIEQKAVAALATFQAFDVLEIHGIAFAYWFPKVPKPESVVRLFCNVDQMQTVPGLSRGLYAYDAWLAVGYPEPRADVDDTDDTAAGDDEHEEHEAGAPAVAPAPAPGDPPAVAAAPTTFVRKLGKTTHCVPVFGSDADATARHEARASGSMYFPEFEEATDPESNQQTMTYMPSVWDGDKNQVHLGFKTSARGAQWFAGTFAAARQAREDGDTLAMFMPQVFFTLVEREISVLGISTASEWKLAAPVLLRTLKYLVLGAENLKTTHGFLYNQEGQDEARAKEGLDFKLALAVRGFALNRPEEIERLGLRIPNEAVTAFLPDAKPQTVGGEGDLMLESPMHAENYHALPGHTSVLSLAEWKGNLSQLLREDLYDFYVVTDFGAKMAKDAAAQRQFDAFPADKRYLLFYPEFTQALEGNETDLDVIKDVVRKFGLPEKTNPARLVMIAPQVTFKHVQAVLKPARRIHDFIKNSRFIEAVHGLVPNAAAFLAQLEARTQTRVPTPEPGGQKRPREDEPKEIKGAATSSTTAATPAGGMLARPSKRARKAARSSDESSLLSSEDAADIAGDAKTAKKPAKKHAAKKADAAH
jgi:hypothetical protein